jgi:hypothetical protein
MNHLVRLSGGKWSPGTAFAASFSCRLTNPTLTWRAVYSVDDGFHEWLKDTLKNLKTQITSRQASAQDVVSLVALFSFRKVLLYSPLEQSG